MYQRTQSSMMSASKERRRYMASRAIGLVIRHPSKEAEFYGSGPQMHRNRHPTAASKGAVSKEYPPHGNGRDSSDQMAREGAPPPPISYGQSTFRQAADRHRRI